MNVSEITAESGSAQTFYTFIIFGEVKCLTIDPSDVAPADYYWMPTPEGVKMAFRYREDAERVRAGVIK